MTESEWQFQCWDGEWLHAGPSFAALLASDDDAHWHTRIRLVDKGRKDGPTPVPEPEPAIPATQTQMGLFA